MNIEMMFELLSIRSQLKAHERWSRGQLETYQDQSLRSLREYTYAHSPFYQQFHRGLYDAPLHKLPVLTKSMLMENFDSLVTDRDVRLQDVKQYVKDRKGSELYLGRYWVNSTSGTSGLPGLFLANRDEWTATLAAAFRGFEGAGMKIELTHRTKIAQITSTNVSHMSMQGGQSMGSWWTPVMQLSAGEPVATMVEKLNAWRPEILIAYASIIRILAGEQLSGRLRIAPRSVISGSEVLTPETRRRAELAWGRILFNMYGTTDCGGIGAECNQHRGMHLQEDLSIIEVVDRDYHPVPSGIYGEKLLVTVLGNRTQPLIRYELDDSVRLLGEQCPCGRPFRLITDVQGRVQEILTFPSMAGGSVNVHPIVFHNVMDTLPVRGWQVVQEIDRLHVLLSGSDGTLDEEALAASLRQTLVNQGAVVPHLQIEWVQAIPQAASGKTPLVKSDLRVPTSNVSSPSD